MATNTYVALATQTLASPAASVTFSSIPSGYTDLVLVVNGATSANEYVYFQVGNTTIDTGTNYSTTWLDSRVASARASNATAGFIGPATVTNEQFNTIIHLQNYSNTSTNKTILSRGNAASGWVTINANLWRSTSAINTVKFILGGSGNYNAGTTFSIYGVAAASVGAKATGGTIYSDSSYFYHVFSGNGTFTPTQSISADVLVVAGGGGGTAGAYSGAGGGAGGYLEYTSQSLTATGYTCTVGAGGTAGISSTNGVNSSFGALTAAVGGGGAGGSGSGGVNLNGKNGGSGGGGSTNDASAQTFGGTGTSGQGFAGGGNGFFGNPPYPSGAGGGAGAVGGTAPNSSTSGAGGIGKFTSLSNAIGAATGFGELSGGNYYFAGGGGGANGSVGTNYQPGGIGGGGAGAAAGVAGRANTGGGGGAGPTTGTAGAGGSGLVIVRYAK